MLTTRWLTSHDARMTLIRQARDDVRMYKNALEHTPTDFVLARAMLEADLQRAQANLARLTGADGVLTD